MKTIWPVLASHISVKQHTVYQCQQDWESACADYILDLFFSHIVVSNESQLDFLWLLVLKELEVCFYKYYTNTW